MNKSPLLLITATAKLAGVSPGTIRDYCRRGLLTPMEDSAGNRLFTAEDVTRIRDIYLHNMARASGRPRRAGKLP
jgi:DNA-binding transcriptional MerR regulator